MLKTKSKSIYYSHLPLELRRTRSQKTARSIYYSHLPIEIRCNSLETKQGVFIKEYLSFTLANRKFIELAYKQKQRSATAHTCQEKITGIAYKQSKEYLLLTLAQRNSLN